MSERGALAWATAGHVALILALSFGLGRTAELPPMAQSFTPVEFVEIGLEPTVTTPAPPAPSAPALPALPAPTEPEPLLEESVPPPPEEPAPAPAPAPQVAKPAPAPAPSPSPRPRPRPDASVQELARAERPQPPRPAPPRPAQPQRAAESRFDPRAIERLLDQQQPATPATARPATREAGSGPGAPTGRVDARAMAGLEQAIRAQIAPCWNPPLGAADVQAMTVLLRIRLARDGSVAAPPEVLSQTGATPGNAAYARAFVEAARRAVLRCAPLQLPAELYPLWSDFQLNFDPRLLT